MILEGEWTVTGDSSMLGMMEAIRDVVEFLRRMGVVISKDASRRVVLSIDSQLEGQGCRISIRKDRIDLTGNNMAAIWSGVVYVQKHMAIRGGPILTEGETDPKPLFGKRISQPPYGASHLVPHLTEEYLSDDAFRMLVHQGINGMLVYGDWLFYVRNERFPELNHPDYELNITMLREAAQRAKRYGVKLYYVPVGPKLAYDHPLFLRRPDIRGAKLLKGMNSDSKRVYALCTSHEEVLAFHGEVMGELVNQVPDLGGLVLIVGGEAFKHCYMRADRQGLENHIPTNCCRCKARNPEETVTGLVSAVSRAVHESNSEVEVIVWEYSAHLWTKDPNGMELIRELPQDVRLLTTLDKGQWVQKDGYRKHIWDYSVEYAGPADRVLEQLDLAKQRKLQVYIKTETAIGLECIQFPYMPALQRLADKWDRLKQLQPAGVIQSWFFFGMWGSRAEELGWWADWRSDLDSTEVITLMASRDFGRYGPRMIRVWEKMSTAVAHLPYIGAYFQGPQFLGPAHPLYFDEPEDDIHLYKGCWFLPEHEETFSRTVLETWHPLALTELPSMPNGMEVPAHIYAWEIVFREYEIVVSLAQEALLSLEQIAEELRQSRSEDDGSALLLQAVSEELIITEAIFRTFLSTLHTLRFLHLKRGLAASNEVERASKLQQMAAIAENELVNALAALPLYEGTPWLDLQDRFEDGIFPSSLVLIRIKIASLKKQLKQAAYKDLKR
jgi:hypothetical protein